MVDSRRTVLHVIQHLDLGGEEVLLVGLVAALSRMRPEERHVLVPILGGELVATARANGVEVAEVAGGGRLRRLLSLARLIRRLDPAVIHARLSSAGFWSRIAARMARARGMRVQAHGGATFYGAGRRRRLMEAAFSGDVAVHICVSDSVADHLVAHGGDSQRIVVIPNGVDFSRIPPRPIGPPAHPPRLVCVGRLSPEKGQDVLLAAFSRYVAEGGEAALDLIGDGVLRPRLEAMIAEAGLGDRVHLRGSLANAGARLAGYDGFILPSHTEGLSLALLEAMGAGLPVVATAVGETPAVLGMDGVLVPPDDAEALSRAIGAIVSAPDAAVHAARARERVRADYGIETMAARYAACFETLTGEGG